ncbi:hypothetical protein ACIBCN_19075 [Nocardia sp. NPDC051052]|uniref:hypothetical protein n=1 Tax=Nocardia sp. NPDC051052 TaxID=3364322 RepID=UPI0037930D07
MDAQLAAKNGWTFHLTRVGHFYDKRVRGACYLVVTLPTSAVWLRLDPNGYVTGGRVTDTPDIALAEADEASRHPVKTSDD